MILSVRHLPMEQLVEHYTLTQTDVQDSAQSSSYLASGMNKGKTVMPKNQSPYLKKHLNNTFLHL